MSRRSQILLTVIALAIVFFALRLPGIHLPYHQDEWKNVSASEDVQSAGQFFAHPPLMQMAFVLGENVFGADSLRWFTLLISALGALVLFYVVKGRADAKSAIWSVILYSVCFYNIFGSLQPDVDGAILPLLFLLAVLAYDKGRKTILVVVLMVGMLFKLNFIIVIGAIILDYLWANRRDQPLKKVGWSALALAAFIAVFIGLLYLIQAIYPAFSISFMLSHANQFTDTGGRGWIQILVQGLKACYYLSPLLLVPLIWLSRDVIKKTRPFWLYLILGSIFYFVIFDFSQGALDKYLMFAIVPLAVICGMTFRNVFQKLEYSSVAPRCDTFSETFDVVCYGRGKAGFIGSVLVGLVISVLLFLTNFLPQIVVGLYPKTAWFSNVAHGHWNILTPFTGGSGPIGFYVSFLFIALSFIVTIVIAILARSKKELAVTAATLILLVGITYNFVFAEEAFHGKINGGAATVTRDLAEYVQSHDEIKQVMTYNDIGTGLLVPKYAGRFYAAPQYEEGHREKFAKFTGYYMIVDIPHLYEGFYSQFFAGCRSVHSASSGRISGNIYKCS